MTILRTFGGPRAAWADARAAIRRLSLVETRVLGAHLFDRKSHQAIADDAKIDVEDVEAICQRGIKKLADAGFEVVRPMGPDLSPPLTYVPNDELDLRAGEDAGGEEDPDVSADYSTAARSSDSEAGGRASAPVRRRARHSKGRPGPSLPERSGAAA